MLGTDSKTKVIRSLIFFAVASLLILPTQILLTDEITPTGIADLELAGSLNQAKDVLHYWGEDKQPVVLASLILDFPFLIAYTLLFFYLTRLATEKLTTTNQLAWRISKVIATGFIMAGLFDVFENFALFAIVFGTEDNAWAMVAFYCASIKFAALGLGCSYLLLVSLILLLKKVKPVKQ